MEQESGLRERGRGTRGKHGGEEWQEHGKRGPGSIAQRHVCALRFGQHPRETGAKVMQTSRGAQHEHENCGT